jgi:hypothetical protein
VGISGSGTISYFFPTLMLSLGYTGTMANYMTAPIYACALVASVLVGLSSDHFREKPFHVLGATVVAGVAYILAATVPSNGAKYAFANYKNNETRAVAIAIINGLGNTASIYGSYIWPADSAPKCESGSLYFIATRRAVLTSFSSARPLSPRHDGLRLHDRVRHDGWLLHGD